MIRLLQSATRKALNRPRTALLALGVIAVPFLGSPLYKHMPFVDRIETGVLDLHYRLRPAQPPHPAIEIIGITSESLRLGTLREEEIVASPTLQMMREPWPWNRSVWAAVIHRLLDAGARVIATDLVFNGERDGDKNLATTLEDHADAIVIGSMFTYRAQDAGASAITYVEPPLSILPDPTLPVVGFVNVWPEGDDVVRRGRYRTSLLREFGEVDDAEDLTAISVLACSKYSSRLAIPSYHRSNLINFYGPAGTYRIIGVESLFVDALWQAPPISGGELFRDKLVLIGPAAEILQDQHNTPFGSMPGVEVQANIMATLLTNSSIREAPPWLDVALTVAMAALAALITLRIPEAFRKSMLLLAGAALFGAVVAACLVYLNTFVGLVSPLSSYLCMGTAGLILHFGAEQLERLHISSVLDTYVSPNVARIILSDRNEFERALGGQTCKVTVLFCDIRGFTGWTENTDARTLVAQLNEYFHQMVDVVLRHGGTLQKFIGDALMAVWGDTHSLGEREDAAAAVHAALEMRIALAGLNRDWATTPGRRRLENGIGIAQGDAVVGNVGHPRRMEFTVLGDTVNLAARLEGTTKDIGVPILISESVASLVGNQFLIRSVSSMEIRGKGAPVAVYNPIAVRSGPDPEWLGLYHEALDLIGARRFNEAATLLTSALSLLPTPDHLCEHWLAYCRRSIQSPTPTDTKRQYETWRRAGPPPSPGALK